MTVRHLKVFDCVCRNNSITRAAKELLIAQPAVSSTISEIEKHYGISLFLRVNQRLVLTPEGKNLWIKAQELLSSFEEFENMAYSVQIKPSLKIGATFTLGKLYLPMMVNKAKDKFPDAEIRLVINQAGMLEDKIADGSLDFAIIEGALINRDLKSTPAGRDRLIAACGQSFDIPDELSIGELSAYPFLLRENRSASSGFLRQVMSVSHLTPNVIMESASNSALISGAVNNLGVVVLPEGLLKPFLAEKKLKEIHITDVEFNRVYHALTHKNKKFSKTAQAIFDFCVEEMKRATSFE